MKSNTGYIYAFLLLIGDFVAVLFAFVAAYILRVTFGSAGPYIVIYARDYLVLFLFLSPIWLGIFGLLGLYKRDIYEWRLKEFGRLLVGSGIGIMAIITYEFIVNTPIFPARIVAVYAFVIGYLLLILERTILRVGRVIARGRGFGIVNTMIIGDSVYAHDLLESLKNPRSSGYNPIAVVMDKVPGWFKGKHFTSLDNALESMESLDVHSVILASLYHDPAINERVMATAQAHHCGFRFVPAQNDSMFTGAMEVELFQGMPLVRVHQTPLFGAGRILKRLFDIVAGSLLLIIASPIILLFVLYLVIFDHGTPFYRPKRLTRFNQEVRIFKLRTLVHAYNNMSPEEGFAKMGKPELSKEFRKNGDFLKNDPRINRVGNFMRKTSIDELPQLINVVRGDISLVGPRPLSAFELENYPSKDIMLSVKTGVTGLAVISGRRDIPFEERRKLDIYYVQNWSLWFDIKILLRTVLEVLKARGAE